MTLVKIGGRILAALVMLMVILGISGTISQLLPVAQLSGESGSGGAGGAFIVHTAMLFLAIVMMLILGKGRLVQYGFRKPRQMKVGIILLIGLGGGVLSSFVGSLLPGTGTGMLGDATFVQIVLAIWIWASICEETLLRGLIQGFLQPLSHLGFSLVRLRISLPVLVSALLFGLMHFNPVTAAMGGLRMINIVIFAFILGLIAGYQREKTGSLLPAVLVHSLFNVGGTLTGYVM